jgi:mannose-1-phosphate guanylyltransferase/mannose-6-phosphate isomerase
MSASPFTTLTEAAGWYRSWLADAALPLWAGAGVEPSSGAFRDLLTIGGRAVPTHARARVQARQMFVYASAAQAGFGDRWLEVARRGFEAYRGGYQRSDGLFAILVDETGRVLDDTPRLYEQAFSLLAMAALASSGGPDLRGQAERLLGALQGHRRSAGGFRELTDHPFQSNASMHLLEAALAWEELGAGPAWTALADEIVELSLTRFIDPEGGFLREFFDDQWRPAAGDDGRWVEPGHQFEWAWLLERWGRARGDAAARAAARTLFGHGLRGVDRQRGVAVNVLWDDLSVRDASARLWPQTEYLKAALILGEDDEALAAANGLARYLDVPTRGAWRDKLRPDGTFIEEPAPASSFYHIVVAILELLSDRQTAFPGSILGSGSVPGTQVPEKNGGCDRD